MQDAPDLKERFRRDMWPGGAPETVSGAGSTLRYTHKMRPALSQLFSDLAIRSLLDGGCGDFNWMRHLDLGSISYLGLDIQDEIIAENNRRFQVPGKRQFQVSDVTRDILPPAHLFLCRHVLLHLPFANIADLFENVMRSEFEFLLLSCYRNETNEDLDVPGKSRQINLAKYPFKFPPALVEARIPDWIQGFPVHMLQLYKYDKIKDAIASSIPVLRKQQPGRSSPANTPHANTNSAPDTLCAGQWYPPDAIPKNRQALHTRLPAGVREYGRHLGSLEELSLCIDASLRAFGFFTAHDSRYFEYPCVVRDLKALSAKGALAIEIGAGLSPVPLMLAEAGLQVRTYDSGPVVHNDAGYTSEWGFFDYSRLNKNIESFNRDFSDGETAAESVDVIYSISVIEHMPASVRRRTIETSARALRTDGRLVLTFDLQPGSNALWNRNLGKEVESQDVHGDLCSLLDELRQAGFRIEYLDLKRSLPRSRTDIAVVTGRKLNTDAVAARGR